MINRFPGFRYAVTAIGAMALRDPDSLYRKIRERIRQSFGLALPQVSFGGDSSRGASDAEKLGNLSEAYKTSRIANSKVRIRQKQETLALPILDAVAVSGTKASPTVLAYLTNALPYTQSGYTIRSQKVLEAMQHAGAGVVACTRSGYPWIIGKVPDGRSWTVGTISYSALFPDRYRRDVAERFAEAVKVLVQQARKVGANVLYTTSDFKNAQIVSVAARMLSIPWIYEVRGEPENTWLSRFDPQDKVEARQSEFYQRARNQELQAMQSASRVVVLSELSKFSLVSRGVQESKIYVIPNSVDRELLEEFRSPSQNADRITVGTITSLVGYEGVDDLIRSFQFLDKRYSLVIVGDGESREMLEELSESLKLSGRVRFVGRRPRSEVKSWYKKLDVFAMTRKNSEVTRIVTPIKALEAQALGVPVVASDLPALREVTGGRAIFCTPEDPKSISKAIREAAGNRELAEKSREWVQGRTWGNVSEAYQEVFEDLGFSTR